MTPEREAEVRELVRTIAAQEGITWGRTSSCTTWTTGRAPNVAAFDALAVTLAALDEARRERDEARAAASSCAPECEAMQARLLGAQMLADQRTIERDAARERMAVYRAERDHARDETRHMLRAIEAHLAEDGTLRAHRDALTPTEAALRDLLEAGV